MTAADLQLFPEPDERGDGETGELQAQDSISCAPGALGNPGKPQPELKVHRPGSASEQARRALQQLARPEPDVFPQLDETQREQARSLPLIEKYAVGVAVATNGRIPHDARLEFTPMRGAEIERLDVRIRKVEPEQ